MPTAPRFLYHAYAIPLSGSIDRPVVANIDGQATSAVPRYGGRTSASAPPYMLSKVVSHGGAASHVSGEYQDSSDTHETKAEATLKGLDLEGVVQIDLLTSAVQSSHPAAKRDDPLMTIKGALMQGLTVAGQDIELESWVDELNTLDTLPKLRDYYKNNLDFRKRFDDTAYVGRASELPEKVQQFFPWRNWKPSDKLPEHNGMTILPILRVKPTTSNRFNVYGNVIQIDNFGRIQLGELIVEWNHRRLMMLHAALGSPCSGNITGGCSGGNGGSSDPPPTP
jgi:hypothetical protein